MNNESDLIMAIADRDRASRNAYVILVECDTVTLHEVPEIRVLDHGPGPVWLARGYQLGAEIARKDVTRGESCAVPVERRGRFQAAAWHGDDWLAWVWEPMLFNAGQDCVVGPFPIEVTTQ